MAGSRAEAPRSPAPPAAAPVGEEGEVWAVEVLESAGSRGNAETLAAAVADVAAVKGKAVSIKLVNVATTVPCGLGGSLPVSQVDVKVTKAHEIMVFKKLVGPLLATPAGKKAKPKYIPVRNDSREDGLRDVAHKIKASRLYLPVKKNGGAIVGRLVLELPGGCSVLAISGGKVVACLNAAQVDVFDSQGEQEGPRDARPIDFYDNSSMSECSNSVLGASGRITESLSASFRHVSASDSAEPPSSFGEPEGSIEFVNGRFAAMQWAHGSNSSPHLLGRANTMATPMATPPNCLSGPFQSSPGGHQQGDMNANGSIEWALPLGTPGMSPAMMGLGRMSPYGREQESVSAQYFLQRSVTCLDAASLQQMHFSGPMVRVTTPSPQSQSQGSHREQAAAAAAVPLQPTASNGSSAASSASRSDATEGASTPRTNSNSFKNGAQSESPGSKRSSASSRNDSDAQGCGAPSPPQGRQGAQSRLPSLTKMFSEMGRGSAKERAGKGGLPQAGLSARSLERGGSGKGKSVSFGAIPLQKP